jgi:hypothetical protein
MKMEDVVFLIDEREGPPKLRGPYKKTRSNFKLRHHRISSPLAVDRAFQ